MVAVTRSLIRRALAAAGPGAGLVPFLAAFGLVFLQVAAALNLWNARERGQFNFSPTSSLTISETLRFLAAAFLFKREVRRRAANGGAEYTSIGSESEDLDLGAEDGRPSIDDAAEKQSRHARIGSLRALARHVWGDSNVKFGLMRIALLQMLASNLVSTGERPETAQFGGSKQNQS